MYASLPADWRTHLSRALAAPSFAALEQFVQAEYKERTIYPPRNDLFRAFGLTPFDRVSVVIVGQDPYHGPGQAMGLAFSVAPHVALPPSLLNIYKEIAAEYGGTPHKDGDLSRWAEQGVLLLNATLSVRAGSAGSHQGNGWEAFTDEVLQTLSREREHLVFILWGNYARNKAKLIDTTKHLVLQSAHPSPLSAHNGFFGNGHFRATNEYLKAHGKPEIAW